MITYQNIVNLVEEYGIMRGKYAVLIKDPSSSSYDIDEYNEQCVNKLEKIKVALWQLENQRIVKDLTRSISRE